MPALHDDRSTAQVAKVFWPLLVIGIILASEVAAICSLNFFLIRALLGSGQGWQSGLPFLMAAPLAGLLAGVPTWRRYVILAKCVTIKRGILVGSLSSMLAHPIMWTSLLCGGFLWDIFTHQADLLTSSNFGSLFFFIVASLISVGWITTIVGGIAGALLICLQRTLTQDIEPQQQDVSQLPLDVDESE